MNILSAIFGGGAAAAICIGLLVFLLVYLAGFVLFQRWSLRRVPISHRHLIPGLGAALAATGVGFWLHAADVATASAEAQTGRTSSMSPHELLGSTKMKALPVQILEDQTLVFPNRP